MSNLELLIILPVGVMFLFILTSIGLYVYRDAKQRDISAVLWTFITVLAPMLTGFIIYLLMRGIHSNLKCPACSFTVMEQLTICPKCGAKLRGVCADCETPVDPEWIVCPKCAAKLSGQNVGITPPIRKKDWALRRVFFTIGFLTAAIVAYTLFLFSFSVIQPAENYGMGTGWDLSVEHFINDPEVMAWIHRANQDPTKVYALTYKTKPVSIGYGRETTATTDFIIYRPTPDGKYFSDETWKDELTLEDLLAQSTIPYYDPDFITRSGVLRPTINIWYQGDGDGTFTTVSTWFDLPANLRVYIDGRRVGVEITELDSEPVFNIPRFIFPDDDD
jgi:hypothetical protein